MFLIVGLMISGCSPLVVRYQSNINNPARVKSNIIVRYETSKIDVQFLDLQTQQTITDAITTDLQKNLFFGGKEEVDVLVKVEQLEYSNRPWGILWFPLVIVGLPTGKAEGVAQVAMDIRQFNNLYKCTHQRRLFSPKVSLYRGLDRLRLLI